MGSSVLSTAWKNHERNRGVVAALREKFRPYAAAWRETFRPHATAQRRNGKKNTMINENL
jgi:hypothetical protein